MVAVVFRLSVRKYTKEERDTFEQLFRGSPVTIKDIYFMSDEMKDRMRKNLLINFWYFQLVDLDASAINKHLRADGEYQELLKKREVVNKRIVNVSYVGDDGKCTRIR